MWTITISFALKPVDATEDAITTPKYITYGIGTTATSIDILAINRGYTLFYDPVDSDSYPQYSETTTINVFVSTKLYLVARLNDASFVTTTLKMNVPAIRAMLISE